MKAKLAVLITAVSLMFPASLHAASPLSNPNNRFGVHIIDENDIDGAAELVNSSGGEWGYITFVIREDERDTTRWQRAFDRMREKKLIPIVRIATKMEGESWKKPTVSEAAEWSNFLNSLNWVVKNRYVVLFNEPNHAKEWGGSVSPSEYAQVVRAYWQELKKASPDFFVLPAGFDAAAPNSSSTLSEEIFLKEMHSEDSGIFALFDGWTSHSYPNPGFSSSPDESGKMSIRGYLWELDVVQKLGLKADIPIFITETGWAIKDEATVSEYYKKAFQEAWNDKRIAAVTPFVLSYLSHPFDSFSWKDPETGEYRSQFNTVKSLTKVKGSPSIVNESTIVSENFSSSLSRNASYNFQVSVKNNGQSIWDATSYRLKIEGWSDENMFIEPIKTTKPGEIAKLNLQLSTFYETGDKVITVSMEGNGKEFGDKLKIPVTIKSTPAFLAKTPLDLTKQSTKSSLSMMLNN